jgi:hypothetical protein
MGQELNIIPGHCPKCRGQNLTYDACEPVDYLMKYPFTCDDCGHTDNEWYSMDFIGYNNDADD